MNMKKTIAAVLAIIMCLAAFTGCNEKKEPVSVSTVFEKMISDVTFPAGMMKMDAEYTENQFGFNMDDFEEFVFAKSEDLLLAEFILIFKVKDEKNADAVKTKLDKFLSEQTTVFASYVPEQEAVLKKAVVEKRGNIVFLLSSEKVSELKKIADEYIK